MVFLVACLIWLCDVFFLVRPVGEKLKSANIIVAMLDLGVGAVGRAFGGRRPSGNYTSLGCSVLRTLEWIRSFSALFRFHGGGQLATGRHHVQRSKPRSRERVSRKSLNATIQSAGVTSRRHFAWTQERLQSSHQTIEAVQAQ